MDDEHAIFHQRWNETKWHKGISGADNTNAWRATYINCKTYLDRFEKAPPYEMMTFFIERELNANS